MLFGLGLLVIGTLLANLYSDNLNFNLLKQVLGIIFSASSYFIVFKLANFNLKLIFDRYCKIALFISAFAILEEILHINGIHIRSEFPGSLGFYRVSGFSGEPYNLAMILTPVLLFCLIGAFSLSLIHI